MNILQTNFRCYRPLISNVMHTRNLSDKPGKSPSSPLLGYPVGIDIKDLDGRQATKFAEIYKSAQDNLGADFHLRAKDAARDYLAAARKTVKVRNLLKKTELE